MNRVKQLTDLLGIRYPIIQAPMAGGITTPDLVASVSDAGGLGSFGAAYMRPDELRQAIRSVTSRTTASYQVNLFVPEAVDYQPRHHEAALARLREIYTAYGVDFSEAAAQAQSDFLDQVRVLIEEKTPVVSFTFGIPEKPVIEKLRDAGCKLIGTATCVGEAELLAEAGFDAIVAQGFEAGGHRCTFGSTLQESKEIPNIGLFAFVPQIVARVRVPVIAAGAIMDGKGIVAALTLGAAGCQLGTAFMGCPETALTASWRKALVNSDDVSTSLTKTFSGRFARGIQNRFMDEMEAVKENLPPFPIQNTLTRALRSEAKRRDDAGYQSLWSGQAARLIRSLPAEKLMQSLVEEMRAAVEEVTYFDSRE